MAELCTAFPEDGGFTVQQGLVFFEWGHSRLLATSFSSSTSQILRSIIHEDLGDNKQLGANHDRLDVNVATQHLVLDQHGLGLRRRGLQPPCIMPILWICSAGRESADHSKAN